ncbi:MAG: hypothetical protein KBD66_00505 [Candidatus Doudnabacteria bacterium]|nr:hypothetical protein [Candidatus Doudnabacteria bacterium]
MPRRLIFILVFVGMVGVAALAAVLLLRCSGAWCKLVGKSDPLVLDRQQVHSFEECVAAGNPVMESDPRRCQAGKITFVENVEPAPAEPVVLKDFTSGQVVTSPLTLTGTALGTWFFEASFPVKLFDADGMLLAEAVAQAQSDWMTLNPVSFSVMLEFTLVTADTGYLEFIRDNPSGLPENDASVRVPVRFR